MKPHLPLLAVCALLLAACVSPLPLGEGLGVRATPSLTPGPSPDYGRGEPTPTPTLIPTPTVTPTPSLPPEIAARLAGRDWRIEGDKVMVGDVAWYMQDAEGQWQPAQFVVDFDSFQFSLEGLEIADEDGVVRIYDPNASDEQARLVYEDGKVNILFAVERAKLNCEPTDLKPVKLSSADKNNYWVAGGQVSDFMDYKNSVLRQYVKEFGIEMIEGDIGYTVVIDFEQYCWGEIHERLGNFYYRTIDGKVIMIPLMDDWYAKWFEE